MGIEELDGQRLHLVEHVDSKMFEDALGYNGIQYRIDDGGGNAKDIDDHHYPDGLQDSAIDGIQALGQTGNYVVIDQGLQEDLSPKARQGADYYSNDHDGEIDGIVMEKKPDEP